MMLAALLGPALTVPAQAQSPEDFLARSAAALQAIDAAAPGAALREACASHAAQSFDLPAMAEAVAGPAVWSRLGEARRPDFVAALRVRLAQECVRGRRGGTLTLLQVRGATLTARLAFPDGTERILGWRLRPGGVWGMQATDLVADGVGVTAVLRDEVRAAYDLAGGDAEATIAALSRGAPLR